MVAVAIAKATWNWVRGKCEEAMRERCWEWERGEACRQARLRYRRWQQRREERRGREQRATRRATDATGHKMATQHTKPQGFIIRPPLLTKLTNKSILAP
jgi:hypothetical protein